jgi:coenzyme F420-0:L-glutamate ligase/coenzyme F420-1:gamma-L-glutamate ligase
MTSMNPPVRSIEMLPLRHVAEVGPGGALAHLIGAAVQTSGGLLLPGDIVVVAQKVVSKSEGRLVPAASFTPSERALALAAEIGKHPHKVEAILSESTQVLRARRQPPEGLLITRHRQGWICANAGIDESNLGAGTDGMLLLLPEDPDASARVIRAGLELKFSGPIGVVVSDTFGRPWRNGQVNIALGLAGVPALVDWAGREDTYGRGLRSTLPALADEICAAAGLLMQKDAGIPAVVVRGVSWTPDEGARARDILRPLDRELFL